MFTTQLVEIRGNTYPHRDKLRALGGKWDAAKQCWLIPADKADEARKLVGAERACGTRQPARAARGVCQSCGCRINYGRFCGKCEFGR